MLAVVAERLAHRAARVWREELQRRGVRRRRRDDDRVLHRFGVGESLQDLRDRGALLANGDVNAVELLLLVCAVVEALLIDDRVDSDCGLSVNWQFVYSKRRNIPNYLPGLSIANDELTLAASDRHERVDRLDACEHRLAHADARNDAGRFDLDTRALRILERAFAVDWIAERIDHAAEQTLADRNVDDRARSLHNVAFLNNFVVAKHDNANVIRLQVERHSLQARICTYQ